MMTRRMLAVSPWAEAVGLLQCRGKGETSNTISQGHGTASERLSGLPLCRPANVCPADCHYGGDLFCQDSVSKDCQRNPWNPIGSVCHCLTLHSGPEEVRKALTFLPIFSEYVLCRLVWKSVNFRSGLSNLSLCLQEMYLHCTLWLAYMKVPMLDNSASMKCLTCSMLFFPDLTSCASYMILPYFLQDVRPASICCLSASQGLEGACQSCIVSLMTLFARGRQLFWSIWLSNYLLARLYLADCVGLSVA